MRLQLTPKAHVADLILPGGLEEFIRSRRAQNISWNRLAVEIVQITDDYVTPGAVHVWASEWGIV